MRHAAALVACLLAPSAHSSAAPASRAPDFGEVDKRLDEAEGLLKEIQSGPVVSPPVAGLCAGPFDPAAVSPTHPLFQTPGLRVDEIYDAAALHAECRAVAEGSGKPCEPMKGFHFLGGRPADQVCISARLEMEFYKSAAARSPDAQDRCLTHIGRETDLDRVWRRDAVKEVCSILLAHWGSTEEACRRLSAPHLVQASKQEETAKNCLPGMRFLWGGETECAAIQPPAQSARCLDYAAFRKASAAKDPEACGGRGICRAMMGEGPKACQPYAERMRAVLCAPNSHFLYTKTEEVNQKLKSALKMISDIPDRARPWEKRQSRIQTLLAKLNSLKVEAGFLGPKPASTREPVRTEPPRNPKPAAKEKTR